MSSGRARHGGVEAGMIPVAEARERILAQVVPLREVEETPVAVALGRVLATDVLAPFDVPPNDNSAVDGYALNGDDLSPTAPARLRVIADLPAGSVFEGVLRRGEAIRIMTGAPMPQGADTVIPQELVSRDGEFVVIPARIPRGINVRSQGEDITKGMLLVEAGTLLRPQEMGLLSSQGLARIPVTRRPRVALLSTGDEVAEPGGERRPGQIYDSNRISLTGLCGQLGCEVIDLGIARDVKEELRARLLQASEVGDVVLTSGGVSVGVYDLVKEVLTEIGGIDFWQVNMTPGRPLAPGKIGKAYFYGLPGNPVASMVTFLLFVRPALWKLMGRKELEVPRFRATAKCDIGKKAGRREFKRGILRFERGAWEVETTGPQGSGILRSMVLGNCLIILEEGQPPVKAGEEVWVEPFVPF
ncbi:MAG: molybdopterin molybdotransferase MoeA [Deltaproteobacteria bacterium]|nr:molybdopterin molybdotransferase MoeA [Deltaproteobacteria bacterium]